MSFPAGTEECRLLIQVPLRAWARGSMGEKDLKHSSMTVACGIIQGITAFACLVMDVGPAVQEELDNLGVALKGRTLEGGLAGQSLGMEVTPEGHEGLDHFTVARLGGVVESLG